MSKCGRCRWAWACKKVWRAFAYFVVGWLPLAGQSHQLSITTGYNYQNSDQGKGLRANLSGWFSDLQYDLNEHLAITGEVDSYRGSLQGHIVRQENYVGGPQLTLRDEDARIRPFFYIQTGDQRTSSAGSVSHSFNLQMGGGVELKLSSRVALQVTPVEYNLATLEGATLAHSFGVKTGLIWIIWRPNKN